MGGRLVPCGSLVELKRGDQKAGVLDLCGAGQQAFLFRLRLGHLITVHSAILVALDDLDKSLAL